MRGEKVDVCECGRDITYRGNRSFRCRTCQRRYNNAQRRIKRARENNDIVRLCGDCFIDINHLDPHSYFCEECRKSHTPIYKKRYYENNKEKYLDNCHDYYAKHSDEIKSYMKKNKRIKKCLAILHNSTIRNNLQKH